MCIAISADIQSSSHLALSGRVRSPHWQVLTAATSMVIEFDLVNTAVVSFELKGRTMKWTPTQTTVDNRQFFEVDKHDRMFVKFCLGKTMKYGCEVQLCVDCNVPFVDTLRRLRSAASSRLVKAALVQDAERERDIKKLQKRRTKKTDNYLIPEIVEIEVPADGDVPGRNMCVLYGIKQESIYVELTHDNLTYIVMRIRKDTDAGLRGRTRARGRVDASDDNIGNRETDDGASLE